MQQNNTNTRDLHIEWWGGLLTNKKRWLCDYYISTVKFVDDLSDSEIESIYKAEVLDKQASPLVSETDDLDLLEGITPGEWILDGLCVRNNMGEFVAGCMTKNGKTKEDYANARLISAAPRLARENKKMRTELDTYERVQKIHLKSIHSLNSEVEGLREQNKALKQLEATFYTNIVRAFNAGKENMKESQVDDSKFVSSEDYFNSTFPDFTK